MNNIPKLIMMIGIPGSGKSAEAELIAKEHNAVIHASDKLREELFQDINHQKDNGILFTELHKRIIRDLKLGLNVVYDATNINAKKRMSFLRTIRNIKCEKIGIIMATPYEQCLKNNENRERSIPEEVIKRMYLNFETPYYYEGFDEIQIVLWDQEYTPVLPIDIYRKYKDYSQENEHHRLSLGQHLEEAFEYACEQYAYYVSGFSSEVIWACLLHDVGKPFTKTFKRYNGEEDGNAHYYNHMNVGAYDSFFLTACTNEDSLLVSWLICNHMEPYFWPKCKGLEKKQRKLWGEDLYEMILCVHDADVAAH